jgi:hypothetical protein
MLDTRQYDRDLTDVGTQASAWMTKTDPFVGLLQHGLYGRQIICKDSADCGFPRCQHGLLVRKPVSYGRHAGAM